MRRDSICRSRTDGRGSVIGHIQSRRRDRLDMSPSCRPVSPGVRSSVLCVLLLSGLSSCLRHYVLVDEPKTWRGARSFCRRVHADLATVDGMEDVRRLVAAARGYEGDVWIGRHDKPQKWRWSENVQSLLLQGQNFQTWQEGEPDKARSASRLCVAAKDGQWLDYSCSGKLAFVCVDRGKRPGGSDPSPEDAPTPEYFFINNKTTWERAQAHCRRHHTDLASVRNAAENELVRSLVPSGQRAAIGLHRRPFEDNSDRSASSFVNWVNGHPKTGTGNCVVSGTGALRPGKWAEKWCGERFRFMCNRRKHLFYIKVKVLTPAVDVTHAILNAIEEAVTQRLMSDGFRSAWIREPGEDDR